MNFLLFPICLLAAVPGPATPALTARSLAEANAQAVRVTLIDPSLRTRAVELAQLEAPARAGSPAQCIFVDDSGARNTITSADNAPRFPLAIAPEAWAVTDASNMPSPGAAPAPSAPPRAVSTLELVDGQRLTGSLSAPTGNAGPEADQSLRWNHPRLGVQSIPLERVHTLRLAAPATPEARLALARQAALPGTPDGDVVLLINGDRLTGFVDSIGGPSGEVVITPQSTPGAKPQSVHIALEQTAYIALANPLVRPAGIMLWLADGSVVTTDRFEFDAAAGRITLAARGAPASPVPAPGASLDLADLRAVALDAARLAPVSSLKLARFAPASGRRLAEPPQIVPASEGAPSPLGADDILLPGPMFVEWQLPARATRLAGWITLEPSAWSWGDCTITIGLLEPGRNEPSEALARQTISASQPIMPVNVELPAITGDVRVRITLDAGPSGPIQDRVRLRRMLVVTEPSPR